MIAQAPLYLFVTLLFLVGVLSGASLVPLLAVEKQQWLATYLWQFLRNLQQEESFSSWEIFGQVVQQEWLQLGWMSLWSLSVFGLPFLWGMLFLQGMALGFTVGFLIQQLTWQGVGITLLAVLPHNLFEIPIGLTLTVAGTAFALRCLRDRWWAQRRQLLYPQMAAFLLLTASLATLLLGVAAIEAWLIPYSLQWFLPWFGEGVS